MNRHPHARDTSDPRPRRGVTAAVLVAVVGIGIALVPWRQTDGQSPSSVVGTAQAGEPAPTASAGLSAEEALQLVREHFPAQYQGRHFHRLWLLRDAEGRVLQSGELQPSQDWSHVEEQLRGLQGHTPGPWRRQRLRNAAGQLIELSVSEVDLGEPRR